MSDGPTDEPTRAMPGPERYADDARRYRLDSRIATGGMGEVWRATDTVLGRAVAVKLLKHEYADDARFRTRFESEARHAGALTHAGIAGVYDFGEGTAEGSPRPFLVMELVDGQPLSALLRPQAPMDPEVAQDLLAQAADALGAAHTQGIVHRDVKPANLIVTPDRRIKVTDFGIARAADGVALTETGQVLGTPQYLSPEQARGETATAASDVYSLGVVAYQCLAGEPPFRGDSPVTTALAHLRDPVPELPADVPEDLAAVVRTALAKDPADRYADGRELAAALRDPHTAAGATAVLPAAGAGLAGAAAGAAYTAASGDTWRTSAIEDEPGAYSTADDRDDSDERRGLPPWLPWLLLLLVLGLGVWFLLSRSGDDGTPEPTTVTETATATASPEDTASSAPPEETTEPAPSTPAETPTSEEPETITLDPGDYLGRDVKDVERELENLGLEPSSISVPNDGSATEDTVASIEPTEGLVEGDSVALTYYDAPVDDSGNGNGNGNGSGNGNGNGNGGGNGNGNGGQGG